MTTNERFLSVLHRITSCRHLATVNITIWNRRMPYSLSFLLAGKFSDMGVRPGVDTGRRGLTLPACTGRTI